MSWVWIKPQCCMPLKRDNLVRAYLRHSIPHQRRNMDLTQRQREILETARTRRRLVDHLTIEELSEFLAVSIRTIQRMHATGQGPPRIRRSHRHIYPISDLLQWLGQNKVDKESRGESLVKDTVRDSPAEPLANGVSPDCETN